MQLLHAAQALFLLSQNALSFALFRQQMHTARTVCTVYAGYAGAVYDDESKSVIRTDISTLSTWLSTVFHVKSLDFWPCKHKACGKLPSKTFFPLVETALQSSCQVITRHANPPWKRLRILRNSDKFVGKKSPFPA
jgi:hypothetical protein